MPQRMNKTITLSSSVYALPGIGKSAQEELERAGICTVLDLLDHFPREYQDYTNPASLKDAHAGDTGFYEAVICSHPGNKLAKNGARVTFFSVGDNEEEPFVRVTVFNQPYLMPNIRKGNHVFLYGEVKEYETRMQLTAQQVLFRRPELPISALYSLPKGVPQSRIRRAIAYALDNVDIPEKFTDAFLERYNLVRIRDAYRLIHTPKNADDPVAGMRRFSMEESFVAARALDSIMAQGRLPNTTPVDGDEYLRGFTELLPFTPTDAQMRAMRDIARDLEGPTRMNRLIQGDVGSGKTIVALFGAYCLMEAGYDAYLLVPTEVLARQHAAAARSIIGERRVVCVTGQMRAKEKRDILERIAFNSGTLIVGTHALLYGDAPLGNPGIVIADEQHRFGVRQRQKLVLKTDTMHSLTMSATPIPRSLALALHGQTNVSVIDELPPGRQPIKTSYVRRGKIADMWEFIANRAKEGKQAYVVCPAIEENEDFPMQSACETYEMLKERFPGLGVGLLHGRCSADEKEATMHSFARGELQVLVATTVIEVGVDVPNASVMIILDADRFGLAQLHQLRGRVGRGTEPSFCFLTTDRPEARARLNVLCSTNNGFEIAEADLQERGAGDFLGDRQHGTSGVLSLLTEGNEHVLEFVRKELSMMSMDPAFAADFELITRLAQNELDTKLDEVAMN